MVKSFLRRTLKHIPGKVSFYIESAYVLLNQRIIFDLRSKRFWLGTTKADPEKEKLLSQLSKLGYVTIPDYKSRDWCNLAASELIAALGNDDTATHTAEDDRVFGIERASSTAAEFAHDPFLSGISSDYARSDERLLFCMANRVLYKGPGSYGSGGEWHRDGFRRQMKAMLYLTDVENADGPFSVLAKSHRLSNIFRDARQVGRWISSRVVSGVTCTRLKDAGDRFDILSPGRVEKFAVKAGTLILFDTSTIHAGQPPQPDGKVRLALTNYYCHESMVNESLDYYRKFVKVH
ncbi:phytanoyl-CoA dioxygenase family protein [Pseudomonas sp. 14P_8.1_Bac3]|uniref:phytanoyl-CoA dioxygenase family protein n=1 Tax=Pseudomonas sp. 14P_8.1_Bac3 TaxID=2971621 RepID=UPI0021CA4223|nr:phytanoyl-CoA dioxygenase family protein [Pseudomonas sp. 14P_8.1_Bac3]MCU1760583.1 phytanoyl-CoA dioxygenase family protein [Pseudomonas sp. 14P_8.1_Bac3]